MQTKLDHALSLAAAGFWVFPILPWPMGDEGSEGKTPAVKFKEWATRDPETLRAYWAKRPENNIGIFTGKFGDDEALLVVDVDTKEGKQGARSLLALELAGHDLPDTREHVTATGGRHLLYRVPQPVRQGTNTLGPGLDTRSRGGYVVAPGSVVGGQVYGVAVDTAVAPAPGWLVDRCGQSVRPRRERGSEAPAGIDRERAHDRAARYLREDAPLAVEGQGGDETTYKVAARLKDFGVEQVEAERLMLEHWNLRCAPPWPVDDLIAKVKNAYAYGQDAPGAAAPEAEFKPVAPPAADVREPQAADNEDPIDRINKHFAFVLAGGGDHILWETTDADGRWALIHLNTDSFHRRFAADTVSFGEKTLPVTKLWMTDKRRRTYDGLVFQPELAAPARFYNLWRGFAVQPEHGEPTPEARAALDAFLAHANENVCNGNEALCRWLIGFFAHLVQRPWEKPLVAPVFKGGKGVGKNALVERVGALLGGHFLLTSNRRYLVGNFNGHLENCLLFTLDEAFWSGDKQAEGIIKDLITGKHHVVEHKGKEPYTVDNRTRICIIGNENWLIPASHDERRFAVFEVGDGRKQDLDYFEAMRVGMERGGYRLLLSYLQGYDLAGLNFNAAPSTDALLEQKHATLEPFPQWWLACLTEGKLAGGDFDGWPGEAECERLRGAFRRHARDRGIRSRLPDDRFLGRELKAWGVGHKKTRASGYVYVLPSLADARAAWSRWIGHEVEWSE